MSGLLDRMPRRLVQMIGAGTAGGDDFPLRGPFDHRFVHAQRCMAKPAGVITDLFKQPLRSWRVPVTDLADLPRRVQRLRTDLAIAGDGYFMVILPAAEQLHRVIAHRYNDEAPVYDSIGAFRREPCCRVNVALYSRRAFLSNPLPSR